MFYEYLLELRAYYNDESGHPISISETVTCWGEDEYDALITQIEDHRRRRRNLTDNIYYKLSRLRPTGRSLENRPNRRESVPFFNTNVRPYIKGLITRFMVRFIVSDTIEKIDMYKDEFDKFLNELNYRSEFDKDVLEEIIVQYEQQRNRILAGEVIPMPLDFDEEYFNECDGDVIEYFAEHASELLKMFGYRVTFRDGIYHVIKPIYYNDNYMQGIRQNVVRNTPVELTYYWSSEYDNCTTADEKALYGLKETPDAGLIMIGIAYSETALEKVKAMLSKYNIKTYYLEDIDENYPILVLNENVDLAERVARLFKHKLQGFVSVAEAYFANSDMDHNYPTGSCLFCGSSTYGDTLCPDCANNVD